jgi:hypothetical protein
VKYIIILGQGWKRFPLIKRARKRGYYVIATPYNQVDIGVNFTSEALRSIWIEVDTNVPMRKEKTIV